jgi:hypothetical protein
MNFGKSDLAIKRPLIHKRRYKLSHSLGDKCVEANGGLRDGGLCQ